MPAAVIPGESMNLVDDDQAKVREEAPRVDGGRDQHHLQRLGGCQQAIGRFAQDPSTCCLFDVSVPERRSPPEQVSNIASSLTSRLFRSALIGQM